MVVDFGEFVDSLNDPHGSCGWVSYEELNQY